MKILHLDSSIQGDASVSRQLSRTVVDALRDRHPAVDVHYRDLVAKPIPHLDGGIAAGFRETGIQTTNEFTLAERTRSEMLVNELLSVDVLVVGAPMYNFGISTQLKAWIDRIVQPGRTFQFSPTGPIGKATGVRAIIASSRGGAYNQAATAGLDFQENYLKSVFRFIGITDVQVVRAEGVKGPGGAKAVEEAVETARMLDA